MSSIVNIILLYIHFWEPPPPSSFIFAYLISEAGRPAGAISLCSMSFHKSYIKKMWSRLYDLISIIIIICSHTYFSNDSDVLQVTGSNLWQGRMCHMPSGCFFWQALYVQGTCTVTTLSNGKKPSVLGCSSLCLLSYCHILLNIPELFLQRT